jgi:hypothetical protein
VFFGKIVKPVQAHPVFKIRYSDFSGNGIGFVTLDKVIVRIIISSRDALQRLKDFS